MVTMTIHADDTLADAIRQAAQDAGQSINVFIKETMGSALGVFKRKRKTPDFLLNLPTISQEGYDELMSVQKDFEAIDEDQWK